MRRNRKLGFREVGINQTIVEFAYVVNGQTVHETLNLPFSVEGIVKILLEAKKAVDDEKQ